MYETHSHYFYALPKIKTPEEEWLNNGNVEPAKHKFAPAR